MLNEISISAQHWQQQALGRVFEKSNEHWFWGFFSETSEWDHRLRVFGKTGIKQLPLPGIWKNRNQRATTSSGYLKTLNEVPGFMKEPEGFCGYLTFSKLWEPRLYIGLGYFLGVWEPWLRTPRAALIPGGVLWCSFLCPPNTGDNHCVHNKQARCTSKRASRRWNGIFFGWRWVHEMYVGARNPGCHKSWEKNSKELEKTLGFLDFCVL